MKLALSGWAPDGAASLMKIGSDADQYQVTPRLVLELAADRVALIVSGVPADDGGNPIAGHVSSGLIAAYWFERREGQWAKVAEQREVDQIGASGSVGELKPLDLGGGHLGFSAEWGSCWQGSCIQMLHLYDVQNAMVQAVFDGLVAQDTSGAHVNCDSAMKVNAPGVATVKSGSPDGDGECMDITSAWRIESRPEGVGDLRINYTGKRASSEQAEDPPAATPAAASVAAESASDAEGSDSSPRDEPPDGWAVVYRIEPVKTEWVLRLKAGKYQRLKGENPCPGV